MKQFYTVWQCQIAPPYPSAVCTVLPMLKTEAYYPTKHPELETKYGMLGGKD